MAERCSRAETGVKQTSMRGGIDYAGDPDPSGVASTSESAPFFDAYDCATASTSGPSNPVRSDAAIGQHTRAASAPNEVLEHGAIQALPARAKSHSVGTVSKCDAASGLLGSLARAGSVSKCDATTGLLGSLARADSVSKCDAANGLSGSLARANSVAGFAGFRAPGIGLPAEVVAANSVDGFDGVATTSGDSTSEAEVEHADVGFASNVPGLLPRCATSVYLAVQYTNFFPPYPGR